MKLTTAQKLYRTLSTHYGRHIGFAANIILTGCTKPTTKLRNLKARLDAGQDVRIAQFDISRIVLDGEHHGLSVLDKKPAFA